MKIAWKSPAASKRPRPKPDLPFGSDDDEDAPQKPGPSGDSGEGSAAGEEPPGTGENERLFNSLRSLGNHLAESGKYSEALSKWEAALNLVPDDAVLHEQKAQVLLEVGDSWSAVKAATRATQIKPSWPEAWLTLGRAQLNFGEPDAAIVSFDKALAIEPDLDGATADREAASRLVKKRGLLHASGLSVKETRYRVGEKAEEKEEG